MNLFLKTWKEKHAVLPVIHVESYDQARSNTDVAFNAGSDGVFLINHSMNGLNLLAIAEEIRRDFPDRWVGINCLGFSPDRTLTSAKEIKLDGVWVDNAMIDERPEANHWNPLGRYNADRQENAKHVDLFRSESVLYFGGVAFKHQRQVKDYRQAANIATRHMDVVTTSGPATGKPADIEKIVEMRAGAGESLLAIASGLTPDNVKQYLPYANCFLVATGISKGWNTLDPDLTKSFIQNVRAGSP